MLLLIVTALLFLFYAGVIVFYYLAWKEAPVYNSAKNNHNETRFSVIIPARNEAHNIEKLLRSLEAQTYSQALFEVIVIDDQSTDETVDVVNRFKQQSPLSITIAQLSADVKKAHKKRTIEKGILLAVNEWIVCTDADCTVPATWLHTLSSFIRQKNSMFVVAPVAYIQDKKASDIFQVLDFMTLQGITAASVYKNVHSMCNGANLAYHKEAFLQVGGFAGIDNIASGDDMLLMYKIWKAYPDRVHYLKSSEAIVRTDTANGWKAFFNQRVRWASKAPDYDDKRVFIVLLLVYLFNLSYLVLGIAAFFNIRYLYALIIFITAKVIVEFPFVYSVSRFFGRQSLMKYFPLFQPLHILYTIIVGLWGSFGKYEWKNRKVR
ncbi:MAG: glycosyltransferase [Niabella sp.]